MRAIRTIKNTGADTLRDWATRNKAEVEGALTQDGIALFRGFAASSERILEDLLLLLEAPLMEDARWSSPRSLVDGKTFTSTEYPPAQEILLHSEMAYLRRWPRLLAFECRIAATSGGQTSVCHIDDLSADLGDALEGFHKKGVQYIRNYRKNVDIPWQNAFGTSDKQEVDKIAHENSMSLEWLPNDCLRTRQVCQGTIIGEDGRPLWFNQAHIFHPAQLPEQTREGLLKLFGEDGMPRTAKYGNGDPIDAKTIHRITDAMNRCIQNVEWEQGDVVVIDNMRWLHGRRPFEGKRLVTVALGREQRNVKRTPLFGPGKDAGKETKDNPPLPGDKPAGLFKRLLGK